MAPAFDYKRASDDLERTLGEPMVADAFPYRVYTAIHDARTSKPHRAMEKRGIEGTAVYFKDDPVWKLFRPPWGPRHCRCGWIHTSVETAAEIGVNEAKRWLKTGVEPAHEFVAQPSFSAESVCEPGVLYACDNPLILDDLRSGNEFRVQRAMKDIRLLVDCGKELRALRDSLMTVPELIGMADALTKVDTNALAAWPSLIFCFVSRMSRRRQGEVVLWQTMVYEALRHGLNAGDAACREAWLNSEDATPSRLVEALDARNWEVRKAAAERLGQFGHAAAGAIGPLEQRLSDKSKYVRLAASDAINRIRSE
jgi:hypothetical protein